MNSVKNLYTDFINDLTKDGFKFSDEWRLARYNPPFTIPFLRKNELWVSID